MHERAGASQKVNSLNVSAPTPSNVSAPIPRGRGCGLEPPLQRGDPSAPLRMLVGVPELQPLQGLQPDTEMGSPSSPFRGVRRRWSRTSVERGFGTPDRSSSPSRSREMTFSASSGSPAPPPTLFDLDVMAWFCEHWREGERDQHGLLCFTLYELGRDLHGRKPSGRDRQEMRASLDRLYETSFELEGYRVEDAARGRLSDPVEGRRLRLLSELGWSRQDHHEAVLARWLVSQLDAGYLTYLDWRVLRKLEGLAKRLWVYLESQSFKACRHRRGCRPVVACRAHAPSPRHYHKARAARA